MRLRMKAVSRFDQMLDVREFVRTHMNLALLVSMIMTREQAFLFQHHRARAITVQKKISGSDDTDDTDAGKNLLDSKSILALAIGNYGSGKLPDLPHCSDGGSQS